MAVNWQVETLRITVFPVDIDSVSPSKLWEKYKGEPKPEIHIEPGSTNQRNAKHGNGDIYLIKTQSQIDWRYILPINAPNQENNLPTWGDLEYELTGFLEFSQGFLQNPSMFPVKRLAFGAVLMKAESDDLSVYKHIGNLLPQLNLKNVADFGYEISRPRTSNVLGDVDIYRLSRWHLATLTRNISTLDPEEDVETNPLERLFAARLELDINTTPDNAYPLTSELLFEAFEELVSMGLEIAREGDIE